MPTPAREPGSERTTVAVAGASRRRRHQCRRAASPASPGRHVPPEAALVSPARGNRLAAALPLTDATGLGTAVVVAVIAGGQPIVPAAAYAVVAFLALSASGLHRLRICLRLSDQVGRILAAVVTPVAVLLPWAPATPALRLAAVAAGLVLALRWAGYAALRAARRSGHLTERALLVGAGETGAQIASLLGQHPELGLRACGFLDGPPLGSGPALPVLGRPADLAEVVGRYGIGRVIVCFSGGRDLGTRPRPACLRGAARHRYLRGAPAARAGHGRAPGLPRRDPGHPSHPAAAGQARCRQIRSSGHSTWPRPASCSPWPPRCWRCSLS